MRKTLLATACAALFGPAPALAAAPIVNAAASPAPASLVSRFGRDVRARLAADGVTPRQLHGLSVPTQGSDLTARAAGFLASHRDVLGLAQGDVEAIDVQSPRLRGPAGEVVRHIVRLRQTVGGLPVEGRVFTVTLDAAMNAIALGSDGGPLQVPRSLAPRLDAAAAGVAVERRFAVRALPANATLVLLPGGADGATRLAWRVPSAAVPLVAHFIFWVDAIDGTVLRNAPAGPHQGLAHPPQRNAEEEP
jgi:hypothetical protein